MICGAGPIGLIALVTARGSGAYPLLITDIDAGRLQFAEKFVPGCLSLQVRIDNSPEEMASLVIEKIQKIGGEQPQVVYECTGVQNSIVTAAHNTTTWGRGHGCGRWTASSKSAAVHARLVGRGESCLFPLIPFHFRKIIIRWQNTRHRLTRFLLGRHQVH